MKIIFLTLLMGMFISASVSAESGPLGYGPKGFSKDMETDRPDFTESTQTIEAGHAQFESGYTYYHDTSDSHVLPELLNRIGLSEAFELRIYWEGYHWEADSQSGSTDFSLGYKQRLINEENFSLSYILSSSIPAGNDNQTANETEPEFKLLWAYDINEKTAVAGNFNLSNRNDDGDRYFEPAVSLTMGRDISENIAMYTEYFGVYPEGDSENTDEHYINGGFTCMLNPSTQLDIRAGFGLNSDSTNSFSGIGLSWRI